MGFICASFDDGQSVSMAMESMGCLSKKKIPWRFFVCTIHSLVPELWPLFYCLLAVFASWSLNILKLVGEWLMKGNPKYFTVCAVWANIGTKMKWPIR